MRGWGPSHQQGRRPRDRRWLIVAVPLGVLVLFWELVSARFSHGDSHPFGSAFHTLLVLLVGAGVHRGVVWAWRAGLLGFLDRPGLPDRLSDRISRSPHPAQAAREESLRHR